MIKYYKIGNKKYSVEKAFDWTEVIMWRDDGSFGGSWVYTSDQHYAEALADIMANVEIDHDEFERD